MRLLLPLGLLALAACSSDPPPCPAMIGSLCVGHIDTVPDSGVPSPDVPVDLGAVDAGVDVVAAEREDFSDVVRVDTSGDTGADSGVTDGSAVDVPAAADAADAGVDVGSDVPVDIPRDAPADAQINCQGAELVRCRTSAECVSTCLPHTSIDTTRWCCIGGGEFGECGGTTNTTCPRP
ncbi:MAG: hypothetical protein ACEQSX_01560 [Baekduiaceae bacterium]